MNLEAFGTTHLYLPEAYVSVEHSYIVTWWVPMEASIAFNASSERCSAVSMGSNFKVSCLRTFSIWVNFFVPNQNCIWSSKIKVPITNHKFGAIFLASNTAEIMKCRFFFKHFEASPLHLGPGGCFLSPSNNFSTFMLVSSRTCKETW